MSKASVKTFLKVFFKQPIDHCCSPSMSQRITPYIIVADAPRALDYYQSCMNAKVLERMNTPDGRIMHCSFELPNGAQVMMSDVKFEYD